VEKVLKDFEIKKEQGRCIVTDNASNTLSTIKRLNTDEIDLQFENESPESESQGTETEQNDDILYAIEAASKLSQIHHMRCVAHTLQLAIRVVCTKTRSYSDQHGKADSYCSQNT
jgi:hypothetical protein